MGKFPSHYSVKRASNQGSNWIRSFWDRERFFQNFVQPLNFHAWQSVCLLPFLELHFFPWCGGLDHTDRNQGQTEELKSVVTPGMRAQESESAEEGLRKVPDIYKDDLAQRRIQGSQAPHREIPSFVSVSNITEADLETWERLKVSGKMRCVLFFLVFPWRCYYWTSKE